MSLEPNPAATDDQALTPTPGSPRPYLSSENHDRLNSIQLSSDASGEFSTTHSPHSLLGAHGEVISELRNALNPPWLHGLTGTPPSLMGINRTDQATQWVEDALRKAERPTVIDIGTHVDLARLSLVAGSSPKATASRVASAQASPVKAHPLMMRPSESISSSHAEDGLDLSARSINRQSPFDEPINGSKSHFEHRGSRPLGAQPSNPGLGFKVHDSRSGDGSSEEEESWPMPATPFLNEDLWNKPIHRNGLAKDSHAAHGTGQKIHHVFPGTDLERPAHNHRKNGANGRAIGLLGTHRAKEGERRVGRCKMYNCDKGVGFLIDDRLDEVPYDVKIHWTDLYSDQEFKSLAKGELVEYTLNITSNGFSASYVTGPGGRPVMGAEQTIVQASRQTSYKLFKAGVLPVKTYRSKWENVPVGYSGSPEVPVPAKTASYAGVVAAPAKSHNSSERPINATAFGNPAAGHNKNIKLKFPANRSENVTADGIREARITSVTEANSASTKHGHIAERKRATERSPAVQLSTPAWGSLRSSLNVIPTPSSLHSYGTSSYTPLLGFSHTSLTPTSAESFDPVLLGGYPSQSAAALTSVRSPAVQITTPGDLSNAVFPNQIINGANSCLNQRDIQTFIAERQFLLQHQAALVSLYQNVNSSPGMALSNKPSAATQVPSVKSQHLVNPAQNQRLYAGAYDRASHHPDSQSQLLGLLPPIVLPKGKISVSSDPSSTSTRQTHPPGVWKSPDFPDSRVDNSASLRPSAQAFMPAGTDVDQEPSGLRVVHNAYEAEKPFEGLVYQAPGRRSVSDPASNGTGGVKKPSSLAQLPVRQNKVESSSHKVSGKHGSKMTNAKRVTFAEQTAAPRRIVSYGGAPTPNLVNRLSPSIVKDAHEETRAGSESNAESVSAKVSGNARRTSATELAVTEDLRRNGDVKSVEIAMERLREAAAPRRLSNLASQTTHQAPKTSPPSSQDSQGSTSDQKPKAQKEDLESPLASNASQSSEIPPDRFNLSTVIKESSTVMTQLQA